MISHPDKSTLFKPIVETAEKCVKQLRSMQADVIIAINHLDKAEDHMIARLVKGIDVIISGHDHFPYASIEGATLILKTGQNAIYCGRIDLLIKKTISPTSNVRVIPQWKLILNKGYEPDKLLSTTIKKFFENLQELDHVIIGKLKLDLDSRTQMCRCQEISIGNLLADALATCFRADIALVNGGFIRGDRYYAKEHILTRGDISREFPFPKLAVCLELSGQDFLQSLESGLRQAEEKTGYFPHVSSRLRVRYSTSLKPLQRVTSLTLDGKEFDVTKKYRIATTAYLFGGGDGYTNFKNGTVLDFKSTNHLEDHSIPNFCTT